MTPKKTIEMLENEFAEHSKDYPRFKRRMKKRIKSGQESGDIFLIGAANYYLCLAAYLNGSEREDHLLYAFRAAAMLEKTTEYKMLAKSYNVLGIAYLGEESYQMALEAYDRAYQVSKGRRNCTLEKFVSLNNIADCYCKMGDIGASTKIFTKCLTHVKTKTPDDHKNLIVYSINLAICYEESGDYQRAKEILDPVEVWADEIDDRVAACLYYARRAIVLFELGIEDEGNRCTEKMLEIIDEDGYSYDYNLEFELLTHNLIKKDNLTRAKKCVDIIRDYSERTGHTIEKLIACRIMADYYIKIGDKERALECYCRLGKLYEDRSFEVKVMQLETYKRSKEIDNEIRKLNRRIKKTEENAARDPITNLLNRSALLKIASEFIDLAMRKDEKIGAIFIDVDYFKECNDTYGHAQGDEVIREVANACRAEETPAVQFARYGGDEFFGITHGLSDAEVNEIARRICVNIRNRNLPNKKNPNGQRITLSVGIVNVNVTDRSNTIIDIANFADKALYHAKASGRNAIYVFDCEKVDERGNRQTYINIGF